jgi:hypothetical protein
LSADQGQYVLLNTRCRRQAQLFGASKFADIEEARILVFLQHPTSFLAHLPAFDLEYFLLNYDLPSPLFGWAVRVSLAAQVELTKYGLHGNHNRNRV